MDGSLWVNSNRPILTLPCPSPLHSAPGTPHHRLCYRLAGCIEVRCRASADNINGDGGCLAHNSPPFGPPHPCLLAQPMAGKDGGVHCPPTLPTHHHTCSPFHHDRRRLGRVHGPIHGGLAGLLRADPPLSHAILHVSSLDHFNRPCRCLAAQHDPTGSRGRQCGYRCRRINRESLRCTLQRVATHGFN